MRRGDKTATGKVHSGGRAEASGKSEKKVGSKSEKRRKKRRRKEEKSREKEDKRKKTTMITAETTPSPKLRAQVNIINRKNNNDIN